MQAAGTDVLALARWRSQTATRIVKHETLPPDVHETLMLVSYIPKDSWHALCDYLSMQCNYRRQSKREGVQTEVVSNCLASPSDQYIGSVHWNE